MTTELNFWDFDVWSFVLTLTALLAAMMLANILIQVVPFIRKLLIPSSVLGGFLLLLANFIYKLIAGEPFLDRGTLEILTYHGLGLGFVAMSLQTGKRNKGKGRGKDVFNTSCIVVGTYLIQAISGLAITMGLSKVLGNFEAAGLLVPLGYGQGPGQAYNWGSTYESVYGFEHGSSFGLTVAAMGFVSASIGGIIYLNVMKRKGRFKGSIGRKYESETITSEQISGKDEIPMSETMDKMTVQFALVFIAYALGYIIMYLIELFIETGILGNFGYNTIRPLIWGFNFLFAILAASIIKGVLNGLYKKGVVKRVYTNDFMQSRIAGVMFDLMVVASIASIDLSAFQYKEFIIPLAVVCVVAAVITYIYLKITCKKFFPTYTDAAWLSLYGMLTGTASTGVILLREVDPKFSTPAGDNLVLHNLWTVILGAPMLLLLSLAPQGHTQALICLGVVIILFILMTILLYRESIFHRQKNKN
ncbi:MAG: hypothetical protein ACOX6J_03615 [Oscillospiraceae bacterium]